MMTKLPAALLAACALLLAGCAAPPPVKQTPVLQSRYEQRLVGHALFAPMLGFLLAFALVASRESVPFLYFQF